MQIVRTLVDGLSGKTGLYNRLFADPCRLQEQELMMAPFPSSIDIISERLVRTLIKKYLWFGELFCQRLYFDEGKHEAICTRSDLQGTDTVNAARIMYFVQLVILRISLSAEPSMADAMSHKLCSTMPADFGSVCMAVIPEMSIRPPQKMLEDVIFLVYPRLENNFGAKLWLDMESALLATAMHELIVKECTSV